MPKHLYERVSDHENSFTESKPTIGVVTDCAKLNVRKYPYTYADVRTIIMLGDRVTIDEDGSTDIFYKVCTATGIDGYCMKQYIEIEQ